MTWFADPSATSHLKGETLVDGIKMVAGYADAVVLRHPQEGSARLASENSEVPLINGGDGAGQHPTQTLLDLFTIREEHNEFENLNIMLVGDLRYGRTAHSLSHALARFNVNLTLVSPEALKMPKEIVDDLLSLGCNVNETDKLYENIKDSDVIYMTRIQKERFPDEDEYAKVSGIYKISESNLVGSKENMIIMHPLPRVSEIHPSVDSTKYARYFQQAFNGIPTRMALLCKSLGIDIEKELSYLNDAEMRRVTAICNGTVIDHIPGGQ